MRIVVFKSMARLKLERGRWHRWFAWHPVEIRDGEYAWLEYVTRKGTFEISWGGGGWEWEYVP